MHDGSSPDKTSLTAYPRFKTGSEPAYLRDRFIHNRSDHQLRSMAVTFNRPATRGHSTSNGSASDGLDSEEYGHILEKSLLDFHYLAQERQGSAHRPKDPELKSDDSLVLKSDSSVYTHAKSGSFAPRIQRLPKKPFRILDIPGLEDDYYTNVLDWSVRDHIAICLDNKVYIHDYRTSATHELYEAFDCETVTSLGFSPDGTQIAFGNLLGQTLLYDVEMQAQVAVLQSHTDRIGALDWKEPGVVSGSKDRTAVFSDPREPGKSPTVLCSHSQEICGVKWNNELNMVATGGNDNRVFVWDFAEKKKLMAGKHASGVKALAWSQRQYGILATGGGTNDRHLRVWNTNTCTMDFERDVEAQVCSLFYSKVTNDVLSAQGGDLNDVRMWRSKGLKQVGVMSGHEQRPLHLALSPDGTVLATASPDEKMCFWRIFAEPGSERDDPFSPIRGGDRISDHNCMR